MEKYIIIFLLSLFQNILAPNLSNNIKLEARKECTTIENYIEKQRVISEEDKEDLESLKFLKMNNKFNFNERRKVREICKSREIETKWLYKIIQFESGGDPKAINSKSGSYAAGLIGFLPSTAIQLGMVDISNVIFKGRTKEEQELNKLIYISGKVIDISTIDQLDYVDKYLKAIMKRYKVSNFIDLYLSVLRPVAIGKPNNFILGDKDSKVFKQNKHLDTDKDSTITVRDIKRKLISFI